jgi:type I restriction enzyme S subunit
MLCDKVYRVRVKNDLALPGYVELVLNSPIVLQVLEKLKTGISDSGVNLTQDGFRELRIPLPSLKVQAAIEEAVAQTMSICTTTAAGLSANLLRASALRQSILRAAFSGKLLPQT